MDSINNIAFSDGGSLRSRTIISRSNARSTGKYPSWKMGRMMHWESRNELNAFRLLDCDPHVWRFNEQPCRIVYTLDGVRTVHYPDVLVIGVHGKEIWEIKTRENAARQEVRHRTDFLIKTLPEYGYTYKLVIAEDMASDPRLPNSEILLRFGRRKVSTQEWEHIRQALKRRRSLSWHEVCRGDYGCQGREMVSALVLRGVLTTDMHVPIQSETRFFPINGGF